MSEEALTSIIKSILPEGTGIWYVKRSVRYFSFFIIEDQMPFSIDRCLVNVLHVKMKRYDMEVSDSAIYINSSIMTPKLLIWLLADKLYGKGEAFCAKQL